MSKAFNIQRGKYDVPGVGKVDATEEVSDEKAFSIYKLPRKVFPWITIGPSAESFLKKQPLLAPDVAKLIQNAQTEEEVELLAKLSDTKTVARIKELRLNSLKQQQQQ